MPVLETRAYAKLNLSLDVLDRRSDGYLEMRMVMQTVTLSDALRLETGTGKPLSMRSSLGFLPADERNLAAAAALRLCAETGADCGGLSIELDKSIPVCAGLAGGSADAAAVLRGLDVYKRQTLEDVTGTATHFILHKYKEKHLIFEKQEQQEKEWIFS